jgi:hypothetical protein
MARKNLDFAHRIKDFAAENFIQGDTMKLRDLKEGGKFYFYKDLIDKLNVLYVITNSNNGNTIQFLIELRSYRISTVDFESPLYEEDIVVTNS